MIPRYLLFAFMVCLTAIPYSVSSQQLSGVTVLRVTKTIPVGEFDGVAYVRKYGLLSGVVAPGERIDGLGKNPFAYTSEFEIIEPARPGAIDTIVVEPENRGNPLVLGRLNSFPAVGSPSKAEYPHGLGNGFLFKHHIAYARVEWQYPLAVGVPKTAQGVGEAIVRDFGAALAGTYHTRLLVGISQSGWFVETFVAEGFNESPNNHEAVYAGAIAIDGTGNWLAINQLAKAHHTPQQPYVDPVNPTVLNAKELLHRPKTDPFFIDVANYTDFYRVHASLTDTTDLLEGMRRYDWPSPHATGNRTTSDNAFTKMGCNGGKPVWLNPIAYDPYMRAIVLELAHRLNVGVGPAPELPPTTLFKLGAAPADTEHFNPLKGATLEVPTVDSDAQPEGGVRFPEVESPIGKPVPVSLNPVITSTINNTCGNLGEWQPIWGEDLTKRYASSAGFLTRYGASLDHLIKEGYVLEEDRMPMLARAAQLYANPGGY
ncbi:MAG: alpha/beta hydrolase domain-containing protein [Vulcanimicrobiaceae bacterium]